MLRPSGANRPTVRGRGCWADLPLRIDTDIAMRVLAVGPRRALVGDSQRGDVRVLFRFDRRFHLETSLLDGLLNLRLTHRRVFINDLHQAFLRVDERLTSPSFS
jgi:hypothetical protein